MPPRAKSPARAQSLAPGLTEPAPVGPDAQRRRVLHQLAGGLGACWAAGAGAAPAAAPRGAAAARDPSKGDMPCTPDSPLLTPLGDGIQGIPTPIFTAYPSPYVSFPYADPVAVFRDPSAPMRSFVKSGWKQDQRTVAVQPRQVLLEAPVPRGARLPPTNHNIAAAFLADGGLRYRQGQPATIVDDEGDAFMLVAYGAMDCWGDGFDVPGPHGGSKFPAALGNLQAGDMDPGMPGPRHPLKALADCGFWALPSNRSDTFIAPARSADSYAMAQYGRKIPGPSALRMGTLLYLPQSVSIASLGLKSEAARQLAWNAQNYGWYLVDDGREQFGFCTEAGGSDFEADFAAKHGHAFSTRRNTKDPKAKQFSDDLLKVLARLYSATNNLPGQWGGPGKRLQPLAPPLVARP